MTQNTQPITDQLPDYLALDYARLREAGIQYLEALAGHLWTDFNAHDPGITILEQVCYAITDLAYRIDYEMPDLLARDGQDTFAGFHAPEDILPSRPVTSSDLRKLVIDVAGVKNARVEPVARSTPALFYNADQGHLTLIETDDEALRPVNLRGLYDVLIELDDAVYYDDHKYNQEKARIMSEVAYRLHANRPVGEDIQRIDILHKEEIRIEARVELATADDPEWVLAEIYYQLAEHIAPTPRFHRLRDLRDAGAALDDLLEGPLLDNGILRDADLDAVSYREALRTSDLMHVIMSVPGVAFVRTLYITPDKNGANDWFYPLDTTRAPRLDIGASAITLERDGVPVQVADARARDAALTTLHESPAGRDPRTDLHALRPAAGRDRHIDHYISIMHQFPFNYGVGEYGLPPDATAQRRAQAMQLKAYLLIFDQILSGYFTQVGHARSLLSFDEREIDQPGYATAILADEALNLADFRAQKDDEAYRVWLEELVAASEATTADTRGSRRNRFLNHLLARHAESLANYALLVTDANRIAHDEARFLRDFNELSCGRGTGINCLLFPPKRRVGGLELRLRRKLGIADDEPGFYMVEHILLRPMPEDTTQTVPLMTATQSQDPFSLQVTFVFCLDAPRYADNAYFREFVETTVREETPAHLNVDIQWYDATEFAAFGALYDDWLSARGVYVLRQLEDSYGD